MPLSLRTFVNAARPALRLLGDFVATVPPDLSVGVRGAVRNSIVDVFGCILGGVRMPVAVASEKTMRSLGADHGSARVFGTAHGAPAHTAAMLNAVSGHALEFDDWEIPGNTHPSVVLFPALLAVMEEGTSGMDLLTAYVAGFEVIARLGEALNFEHYDAGWHSTATLGSIGAAAAVARLHGLSPVQTAHALSIAISRASGLTCQFGADTKALQAGFAAENGVVSAALAAQGATGRLEALEHPCGFAALMAGVPPERIGAALEKLGNPLAVAEYGILIKPWPSCGYTHRIMCCALELARMHAGAGAVHAIDLHLPDFHAAILPFHHPMDRREALFSLPFVAAMGLAREGLTLDDLDQERWQDPDIARLIECTNVHPFRPSRPALNYDPLEPDRMRLTLPDGRQPEAVCALPLGTPEFPMSDEAVVEKFRQNAGHGSDADLEELMAWPETYCARSLFERIGDLTCMAPEVRVA